MEALVDVLKQVIALMVVLVLFALLFRQGFEDLLSKPVVESLAGANAAKLKKFGTVLKASQAYIVIALGCAIAWVLKLDVVTAINGLVALFPEGSMDTSAINLFTGAVLSIGAMVAHGIIGAKKNSPLASRTSQSYP